MRYIISLLLASAALPAFADVPRVVTDIPPVHAFVAQVMGNLGEPVLLLDKGANGHSFQLRPSQAADLQDADLVVWIGPEMSPWLDRTLAGVTDAAQLRLLDAAGTFRQSFEDTHDHEHDDHAVTADTEVEHGGIDPHAWLDPTNARLWLGLIATELARIDPKNAASYAANAEKAQRDVDAIDAEIAAILAPVRNRPFVVFHQAYGYFSGHFGLTVAAAISTGDAASPGAKHLTEVQETLAKGPTCLFPEVNHDPKLALQLAEATGAKLGSALDPEGALLEPGPQFYGNLMRGLAVTISGCLKG